MQHTTHTLEISVGTHKEALFKYLLSQLEKPEVAAKHAIHSWTVQSSYRGEDNTRTVIPPGYGRFEWHEEGVEECFVIEHKEEGTPQGSHMGVIYFVRLTVSHGDLGALKEFVNKAVTFAPPSDDTKVKVYQSKGNGYWESKGAMYCQRLDNIYVAEDMKGNIVKHIDQFIKDKERYIRFGRPWKLGFLLCGVPGSGKTSMAKALALHYKRPLHILNFTKSMTDQHMIDLFHELRDNSVLLIEDVDAFFVHRKVEDINVSFSCFINLLDGAMANSKGTIILLTANNPDHFDPALIRPGRVDRIFQFAYPKRAEVMAAFMDLVNGATKEQFVELWDQVKGRNISMSAYVDYFFRHPDDVMECVEELLEQNKILKEITAADKVDKVYT